MAACQSFPLCARLGLLLPLLIGVISSHLPEVQAKPIDFRCNSAARKYMLNIKIEGLKRGMADCEGYDTLSSPVQLPCDGLSAAAWANKTLQQKHTEVVHTLQVFQDGVQEARNQSTLQCQTTLLEKLGHLISNYQLIVNRFPIQNDTGTPAQSAIQTCSSPPSLNKVLEKCRNLLIGKLERLVIDLQDSMCNEEHKTISS